MRYVIIYYSDALQAEILNLPHGLLSRYLALTDRMGCVVPTLACRTPRRLVVDCLSCDLKVPKALPVCFIARW